METHFMTVLDDLQWCAGFLFRYERIIKQKLSIVSKL